MTNLRCALHLVACGLVGVSLGSCSGKESPTAPPVVAHITVTPGTDTLGTLGRTVVFTAQPVDANGAPVTATVVWRSSNPSVATVDSVTGLATAVTNGTTVISAHVGSVSGQATMAVAQVVAHVVISPPSAGFTAVGDTQRLTAVAKDSSSAIVQGVPFLWFSSDANVATVDTAGLVRSKGPGSGFITAAGRGVPGSAVITVTQTPMRLAFSAAPPDSIPMDRVYPSAIQVEVRDSNNHVATGSRIAVTLSIAAQPGPGTLAGTVTVNAVSGIATFSGISLGGKSGSYRLSASSAGVRPDTSAAFPALPGKLVSLMVAAPPAATAGVSFPVQVSGFDAYGNPTTNTSGQVHIAASSIFGGRTDRPDSALLTGGAATFDSVVLDGPGRFTVTATLGTVAGTATTAATVGFNSAPYAGYGTVCAADTLGHGFCWGTGTSGQLGGGRDTNSSVPRLVARDLVFSRFSVGYFHTCGIAAGGALYCWGSNSEGQLGNGNLFEGSDSVPQLVGGHTFTEVSVGYSSTCAVATTQVMYCWGDDSRGQLGSGKTVGLGFTATPTLVSGGLSWAHVTSSYGFLSVCGLTVSLDAYCWGANEYAQLGNKGTVDDSVPGPVSGAVPFSAIATGATQTCALAVSDSTAYCWGTNGLGRAATQVDSVAARTDSTVHLVTISSTSERSCARDPFSQVWCWRTSGLPAGRTPFIDGQWGFPDAIGVGVLVDCELYLSLIRCRGFNADGALGNGTNTDSPNTFVPILTIQPAFAPPYRKTATR
ncbi:MAG TPA: Ig-like domain-containing protein [Gemmatimonadales bacterium]|nr:Ig-like domain-containing protein [Gemmatimonadales bacterium]